MRHGGHDQVCAAIGAGVLYTDVAIDGTGTVECITSVFDKPQLEESVLNNNFVCVPYPVKGMYTTYAFNFTGGAIRNGIKTHWDGMSSRWQRSRKSAFTGT